MTSIWWCLLIPIIGSAIKIAFFHKRLTWWEIFIPTVACIFFIGIFKAIVEKVQVTDTEYHGALIVSARYYEPYETWVKRTCSYTTCTGSGKTRVCTTHYYDCSYCDYNGPEWEVTNSLGQKWGVSEEYYNYLKKKWSATPYFVELNRDINYHGGCGKDGDAYEIQWDKKPLTSESTTTENSYENRVQAAHTAFDFPEITEADKKRYKLFDYPPVNSFVQKTVLGIDSIGWLKGREKERMIQWSKYLNGHLGPKKHARVYILLFKDMPSLASNMQEAYWSGGNDNELIVCIGLSSKDRKISWVKPFTWSPNRKIIPDVREDIMKTRFFNPDIIAKSILTNVEKEYKRKDFSEFSYLTIEPPTWAKWTTFFVTLIITIAVCYWTINNDIEGDDSFTDIRDRINGHYHWTRRKW